LLLNAGHTLIAKYVGVQLAHVFEKLESIEQQSQQQQQHFDHDHQSSFPDPLLFKSAAAASMKNICLVQYLHFCSPLQRGI
jgi:hypothetical protein